VSAIRELGIQHSPRDERFDQLVEFAQKIFHTSNAAITIIDRQRYWTMSSVGDSVTEGPVEDSFCFTAIDSEDPLVIGDATRDARFENMAKTAGPAPVRFYAGHRIEAPGGVPIGVLCVFDSTARDAAQFDRSLLRDLALLVQKALFDGTADSPERPAA
jgi:GAF domain-containing protein